MSIKYLRRLIWICLVIFWATVICTLAARADEIRLSWEKSPPPVEGYRLYQRVEGTNYNFKNPVYEGAENHAAVKNLLPATQYYFVVRAYYKDSTSDNSTEISIKTDLRPPAKPKIDMRIGNFIDAQGRPYSKIIKKNK